MRALKFLFSTLSIFLTVVQLFAQEVKRPPITGIAHAAFYTKDVESARQFYKNFLGYVEAFSLMAANGKDLVLTFIKINDRQFVKIMDAQTDDGQPVPSSKAPPLKFVP